jgi:xylan 1,4-beta-xylosidase
MHDEPFAAAFATRIVMQARGLVEAYSYWTFTDIFSENYFPSVPFHGGFGLLNLYAIAKPVYRAFQLLHHLGCELLEVQETHATVDAWVVRKDNTVTVVMTNLAMPRHPIQTEMVSVLLAGSPAPRTAWIERIDEDHANPRRLWRSMGEPEYLSALQVEQLAAASALRTEPQPWNYENGKALLAVSLPPQSVVAVTIEFAV